MTRDEAYDFIDNGPRWAVLTTIDREGYPHAVPLSYFRDGDDVVVNARGKRLANMRHERRVALLIDSGQEMAELRGLVIQGDAQLVEEPAEVLELSRRAARRRGMSDAELPTEPRPGLVWARITPRRMRSWDNAKAARLRAGG